MSAITTPSRPSPTRRCGDIDVKLLGAYRWFDSSGTSNSRGLSYDTTIFSYAIPRYQSWQSELTVNGNALDNRLKWTTGLFFFEESDPDDGGSEYLFLPSAGSRRRRVGQADHRHRLVEQWRAQHQLCGLCPGAPTASTSDTRLTAGVALYAGPAQRLSWTPLTIRTPATAGDQQRRDQWRLQSGRLHLSRASTYAGSRPPSAPSPTRAAFRCRWRNARPRSTRAFTSPPGRWRSITTCSTRPWSISPAGRAIARAASIPRPPIPPWRWA